MPANVEELRLFAGAGTGIGNDLNNSIFGSILDNDLRGGAGNDSLFGDDPFTFQPGGNDRLEGGAGNDFLVGGTGRNVYVFGTDFGVDSIGGFESGADLLDFRGSGVTLADIAISGTAGNVAITTPQGSVNVQGALLQLTTHDFLF